MLHPAWVNFAEHASQFAAQEFVAGVWQGTVLAVLLALALPLLKGVSAAKRFGLCLSAFALVLCLPLLHVGGRTTTQVAGIGSSTIHVGFTWAYAIAALWVLLSVWRIGQLVHHGLLVRRIWKAAQPATDVPAEIEKLLRASRRKTQLCVSADVDSPCVIGFFAPRLLMPEALMRSLSTTEIEQIVLHECEHLRRCDDWMNLAQKLALGLFPLSPALLWLDRRLHVERELACDASVIARSATPVEYAKCLMRLVEHRSGARRISLAVAAWTRESELARRVRTLVSPAHAMSRKTAAVALSVLGVALAAGSVEMSKAPRLVSFAHAPVPVPVQSAELADTPQLTPGARVQTVKYEAPAPAARPHAVRQAKVAAVTKPVASHAAAPRVESNSTPNVNRAPEAGQLVLASTVQAKKKHSTPARTQRMQTVYLVAPEFPSSYAAVPFGNGWLIVQL